MYANTYLSLQTLAIAGAGWATLPEYWVAESVAAGVLCRLDTQFEPHGWFNTIDLIRPRLVQEGSVQTALISMLEQYYSSINVRK